MKTMLNEIGRSTVFFLSLCLVAVYGCGGDDGCANDTDQLEFSYQGQWTDNWQSTKNVSFMATGSACLMEGEFFWRSDFEQTGSGPTLISFKINGETVEDVVVDRSGVLCGAVNPGHGTVYRGSGTLLNGGRNLRLNIASNNDCGQGPRDATLILTRVD